MKSWLSQWSLLRGSNRESKLCAVETQPQSGGSQSEFSLLPQWNTYGDPPNSDLLRRYGHVDLLPLPDGTIGNPADVVEVEADLAVVVCTESSNQLPEWLHERIDWWLEQGGDE